MSEALKIDPTNDLGDSHDVPYWTRRHRGANKPHSCLTAWRACQGALALALFALFAVPVAVAQPASGRQTARSAELEKRIFDIVQMFENDPRYNRGRSSQQIKDSVAFVNGNVLFVLAHETAHALISVFELPVLGREEDAADGLATILALKMANPFADRVVANAARGWFLNDQRDKKEGNPTPFYDEHGVDLQRAYNIVCLLVGGEPSKFTALANEVKLPKKRQATCQFDFSNASSSWEQVLKPHLRTPEDPKTRIEVNYGPTAKHELVAAVGRKLQILETVAQWLSEDFVWETPISFEMRECGKAVETRWLPTERKIVVCYEMIREFVQLYRQFGQVALVPEPMKTTKYRKVADMAKPDKRRQSNAFRSVRARVPHEMARDENPGGAM
jgi:hypothetical protein